MAELEVLEVKVRNTFGKRRIRRLRETDGLLVCPSPVPGHHAPSKSKPARQQSSRRFAPPCPGRHDWRRSPLMYGAKRFISLFHFAHAVAR